MKFAVVLLVVLPLAFANPIDIDKRGLLDFLGLGDAFDFNLLKEAAQGVLDKIGSDATRDQCETACHSTLSLDPGHLLHTLCNPLCGSFQAVIRLLNLHPTHHTTVTA